MFDLFQKRARLDWFRYWTLQEGGRGANAAGFSFVGDVRKDLSMLAAKGILKSLTTCPEA
jgi:hypothetical protein